MFITEYSPTDRNGRLKQTGSYTVEAALTFIPFIMAFLAVTMLVSAIRTESRIRYALCQTAKEISGYCYPAGKAMAAFGTSGNDRLGKADSLLEGFADFSSLFASEEKEGGNGLSASDIIGRIGDVKDDYRSIKAASAKLEKSIAAIADDPMSAVSALAAVFFESAGRDAVGRVAATVLCKMLMPKYLVPGGDEHAVSETLKRMGISDGLDGLNFGLSSIMTDGRSINLIVFYELELFGGGYLPGSIQVRQSASTSAWLPEPKKPGEKDDGSVWRLDNFTRGRFFVSEIKKENKSDAVKGGKGFDLYDGASSMFTSVISMNVFGSGYSSFTPPAEGEEISASNYRLKSAGFNKGVREGISELKKSIAALKPGDVLEREFSSRYGNHFNPDLINYHLTVILILPSEAEELSADVERLVKALEDKTGVFIRTEYRYKALALPDNENIKEGD